MQRVRTLREPPIQQFGFSISTIQAGGKFSLIGSGEHQHIEIECVLVRNAALEFAVDNLPYQICGSGLLVFWGISPHRLIRLARKCNNAEDGFFYCLRVPLHIFSRWRLEEGFRRFLFGRKTWFHSFSTAEEAALIYAWIAQWDRDLQSSTATRASVAQEAELLFRRLTVLWQMHRPAGQYSGTQAAHGLLRFTAAVEFLTQNLGERQGIQRLAETIGVSRQYLHRLFRGYLGMSMVEFLNRYRVSYAVFLLKTTDRKIVDIALASGFGTVSQFNRAFKAIRGISPNLSRRALYLSAPLEV